MMNLPLGCIVLFVTLPMVKPFVCLRIAHVYTRKIECFDVCYNLFGVSEIGSSVKNCHYISFIVSSLILTNGTADVSFMSHAPDFWFQLFSTAFKLPVFVKKETLILEITHSNRTGSVGTHGVAALCRP